MNRDFIEAGNNRLLFETPPQKTDVAIVLGNTRFSRDLARVSARYYFDGFFDYIILCGGVTVTSSELVKRKARNAFQRAIGHNVPPFTIPWTDIFTAPKMESRHMADVLLSIGMPKRAIVHIDDRSTNTGENFAFIADHVQAAGYESATIIAGAYHQLRGMETCARWIPDLRTQSIPVYPYSLRREEFIALWPQDDLFRGIVLSEYEKLNPENPDNYYRQGFCIPREQRTECDSLELQIKIGAPF